MKPFLQLMPVDEIKRIIFSLPVLPVEPTPLDQAFGRCLATGFIAPCDLPGFRRSSMDGYAVVARDVFGASEGNPAILQVSHICRMGEKPEYALENGQAAQIFTGGALPDGADAVVMVEHTRDIGGGQIEVTTPVAPGMNIVEADDDAMEGQELIPAGKMIRAQEIGILAAFGVEKVETIRPAKTAIISTGDEIRTISAKLAPGEMRDVNSWSLAAICRKAGAIPERLGIVPDQQEQLAKKIKDCAAQSDVVIVSGGSSAGMRDHTAAAFLELPKSRILVHGAAISPGKPLILGVAGEVILLGLPGHVSSALVCANVFLVPLLHHLQGLARPRIKPWFDAILSRAVASAQGRRDYIRCRLKEEGDNLLAEPILSPSAVLSGLLEADGYVICPENSEGLARGQKVRVYPA